MDNVLRCFVLLSLLLIPLGCQKKATAPKHIFFIVIDTLRADHLGCYGHKVSTSPTIDRLAKEGVLFKNAFSTASNTVESVFSFFSSTTNLGNLVYNKDYVGVYSSLQKLFKKEGFNTLAVVSNPWLKVRKDIFQDGFIHFQFVKSNKWLPNTTDKVSDAVLDFLESKFISSEKNFFYIHYLDPHGPYVPPVDYGFFSGKPPTRSLDIHSLSGEAAVRNNKAPNFKGMPIPKPVTDNELNYIISSYDSEIKHVDLNLKKLLARLQEMNILQDSLIIITADHGEEFLEHGCFKHGFQLYDETIHIPLIFYWQGHLAPRIKRVLVSGIDIAPTILNLCQIKPPAGMLGKNILDKKVKDEPSLFCTHFLYQKQKGMRTIRWKLIENERTGDIKIFDIKNDPGEQNNLFNSNQKKWDHLLKTFEQLLSKHGFQEDEKVQKTLEIDPETREQLKALGYL
jgi:arylsulfatase A-like enzyme